MAAWAAAVDQFGPGAACDRLSQSLVKGISEGGPGAECQRGLSARPYGTCPTGTSTSASVSGSASLAMSQGSPRPHHELDWVVESRVAQTPSSSPVETDLGLDPFASSCRRPPLCRSVRLTGKMNQESISRLDLQLSQAIGGL